MYEFQEFPKCLYRKTTDSEGLESVETVTVSSKEEQDLTDDSFIEAADFYGFALPAEEQAPKKAKKKA